MRYNVVKLLVLGLIFALIGGLGIFALTLRSEAQSSQPFESLEGIVPHVDEEIMERLWNSNDPALSPDGTQMAFASGRNCGDDIYMMDLFIMNADGSEPQNMTSNCHDNSNPAWSPDGRFITFTVWDRYGDGLFRIKLLDTQTGEITTLLEQTGEVRAYGTTAWSPDGTQIAYSIANSQNNQSEIYVMNADGTDSQLIISNGWGVNWSVNDEIVYTSSIMVGEEQQPRFYVAKPDGTDATMVGDILGNQAVWSPDGTRIAYVGYLEGNSNGEIFTVNPDGTDIMQVTAVEYSLNSLHWGSAGIAYYAWDRGGYAIYVVDPNQAHQSEQAVVAEDGAYTPRYPDGNTIYEAQTITNPPETGIIELLRDPVGDYGFMQAVWMNRPDARFFDEEGMFGQINRSSIESIIQIDTGRFAYGWNELICVADLKLESETCYDVTFGGQIDRPYVNSSALDGRLISFANNWGIAILDTQTSQYRMVWDTQVGGESQASLNTDATEMLVFRQSFETQTLYHFELQSGEVSVVEESNSYGSLKMNNGEMFATRGYTSGRFSSQAGLLPSPIGSGSTSQVFNITEQTFLFPDEIGTVVSFDFTPQGEILVAGYTVVVADVEVTPETKCEDEYCVTSFNYEVGPLTLWRCETDADENACEVVLENEEIGLTSSSIDPITLKGFSE